MTETKPDSMREEFCVLGYNAATIFRVDCINLLTSNYLLLLKKTTDEHNC
jgi:hypothetical protein